MECTITFIALLLERILSLSFSLNNNRDWLPRVSHELIYPTSILTASISFNCGLGNNCKDKTRAIYKHPWDILIQTPNYQVTVFPVLKSAAGPLNKLVHDDKIKPSFTVSHNPAKLNSIFNYLMFVSADGIFMH